MNEFESFVPKAGKFLLAEIRRGLLSIAGDLVDSIALYSLFASTILMPLASGIFLTNYEGRWLPALLVLLGSAIISGLAVLGAVACRTKYRSR